MTDSPGPSSSSTTDHVQSHGTLFAFQPSDRGSGVYAAPVVHPSWGHALGTPPSDLIPLTFNIPVPPVEAEARSNDAADPQLQQQQANAPQRQAAIRVFRFVFHIDMSLIIKLVAVVFLFHQDGSTQRLLVLLSCAFVIYLYQTGALAPLIRWLSQNMNFAAAPHLRRPQPAVREENEPLIQRQGQDEGNGVGAGEIIQTGEDENPAEDGARNNGNQRLGFMREIQMIIFGFITSLLPGFHNVD